MTCDWIRLRGNKIDDHGAEFLADALRVNIKLGGITFALVENFLFLVNSCFCRLYENQIKNLKKVKAEIEDFGRCFVEIKSSSTA